ncbi:MAG: MmgE/PrpD family protein [Chloroflexi bacterium]|nr:MmgE/PrpD family protein [Chloroflexota bacterium]
MDASLALARNVVSTSYDHLPPAAVAAAKRSLLDALGCLLAASTLEPACRPLVELAQEAGGKPESSVLVFGGRVSAPWAAFANGALVHALDYEDVTDSPGGHPIAGTLPAALAIAERLGNVTGRQFITALALGQDIVVRLGKARTRDNGSWMSPSLFGLFGGTAAAGKLLGLDEERMGAAFGLALHQAGGSSEGAYDSGSSYRAIRDGFTGKAAALAALLAQKGLTGARHAFEGKAGLFNLFFDGHYDPAPLADGLGQDFKGAEISYKPWPSCRGSHTCVEAVLGLVGDDDIRPEAVQKVELTVGAFGRRLCTPLSAKRRPAAGVNAKFSLPYCVGSAIVRRRLTLGDFTPEAISEPDVLRVAQKVSYRFDPERSRMGIEPVVVDIRCRDGRVFSRHADWAYGNPRNPLSDADLVAKFKDCAAYSAKAFPAATLDQVVELVMHLEEVPEISPIARLLA